MVESTGGGCPRTEETDDVLVPETVVDVLRRRSAQTPDTTAVTFLDDAERHGRSLDYASLDRAARRVAAHLQQEGLTGSRVLLAMAPGLDYVEAFFGCLYAGAAAVPCYPPRPDGRSRELAAIARDCAAEAVLTSGESRATVAERFADTTRSTGFRVMDTDLLEESLADAWSPADVDPADLAFLQYTSGSTGAPKGVIVSHRNIVIHTRLMHRRLGLDATSVGVSWLPPFHDMGLIAFILMPVLTGYRAVLMSPRDFVMRPARWLEAISRHRATIAASPNFGYDLCTERVSDDDLAGLDLSCWRHACNGAEPVRAETLERFTARFSPVGFRFDSFRPCYGLAEATLAVTLGPMRQEPVILDAADQPEPAAGPDAEDGDPVDQAPAPGAPHGRVVGCGPVLDHQGLAIVDPETRTRCPQGTVGEIWASGPSIPDGYWQRPDASEQTFHATIVGDQDQRPHLRTGDMGFQRDGQLFVVGRYKDLIIIRGRNHAPSDIEHIAGTSHPRNRPSGTAAFSVTVGGAERLVVAQEVRTRRESDYPAIVEAIRTRITQERDIAVEAVVLLKPTALPKTTSGKIQRRACRARFLAGALDVLHEWRGHPSGAANQAQGDSTAGWGETAEAMEGLLAEHLGRILEVDADSLDRSQPFAAHGLDSVGGAELTGNLSVLLGVPLPAAALYEHPSIRDLAQHLVDHCPTAAEGSR